MRIERIMRVMVFCLCMLFLANAVSATDLIANSTVANSNGRLNETTILNSLIDNCTLQNVTIINSIVNDSLVLNFSTITSNSSLNMTLISNSSLSNVTMNNGSVTNSTLSNLVLRSVVFNNEHLYPAVISLATDVVVGNYTTNFNITFLVTDDGTVSKVFVNITNTTGVVIQTLIANVTGVANQYSAIFNGTWATSAGNYTYKVFANDTSNKINNTVNSTLVVNDVVVPLVLVPVSNPLIGNQSNAYNLSVNITDRFLKDIIVFNITNRTGVVVAVLNGTYSDLNQSSVIFNTTLATSPGNYSYKIIANDSSGNVNNTVNSTFIVNDITNPQVNTVSSNIALGNQSNLFNITANVTDNFVVDTVWMNVSNDTTPGTVIQQIFATKSGADAYSVIFNASNYLSANYTFWVNVNDTSNNRNRSVNTSIVVNDSNAPTVSGLASNIVIGNQSNVFNLSANVSDLSLDTVLVNVTNTSNVVISTLIASLSGGSQYSVRFNTSNSTMSPGNYSYRFIANDSYANVNATVTSTFVFNDIINPQANTVSSNIAIGNQSNLFNITVNATDNTIVDRVWMNVSNDSIAGATIEQIFGTLSSANSYSMIFNASLYAFGNYTFWINVNDSSNNRNRSVNTSVIVNDNVNPAVSALISQVVIGNTTTNFNMTFNVTDAGAISKVLVNVSNSTNVVLQTLIANVTGAVNQFSAVFNGTVATSAGNYTYKVIANDSAGNVNNTLTSSFIVNDVNNPAVNSVSSNIAIGNTSNLFNVTVNVTDNVLVDSVWMNVSNDSLAGATLQQISGTLSSANSYSMIFNASTYVPANYTFWINANDSSNNRNRTINTSVVVNDAIAPAVTALSSNVVLGNTTTNFNITFNVTDNGTVNVVLVNVSNSTNAVLQVLIATVSGPASRYSVVFNGSYATSAGNYTYKVIANDTFNNINNTATSTFTVTDRSAPLVFGLISSPILGNHSNVYNVSVNVTDQFIKDTVLINVSNSTGVVVATLIGTNSGGNQSSALFNTTNSTSPGNYTYKVIANDTAGNVNNTVTSSFILNDVTNPAVNSITRNIVIGNQSNSFNITVNVTDNFAVDTVWMNVSNDTTPGAVIQRITATSSGANSYSMIFNASTYKAANYTFWINANDSSNNRNRTVNTSVVVNDVIIPQVFGASTLTGNQTTPFNITFNVSDFGDIDNVTVNVTFPNGSLLYVNASINRPGQRSANVSLPITAQAGNYTFRIYAWDTTGNLNSTVTGTIVVADYFNATLIKTLMTAQPANTSDVVTFKLNVTNYGSANLTNISVRVYYNTTYLNFSTSSITLASVQPQNHTLIDTEILDGTLQSGPIARGSSGIFNITFVALKNASNTTTITNFTIREVNGNVYTLQTNSSIAVVQQNVTFTGFPNGTNLSLVNDLTNVSSLILSNGNATIEWINNVDVTGQDLNTHIKFAVGQIQVNTSGLDISLNTTSVVQIHNVTCSANPGLRVTLFDGFNASFSLQQMYVNGRDCAVAGVCTNVSCTGTTLSFTVNHFTAFASNAAANITTAVTSSQALQPSNFTVVLRNVTNGAIITGASCNISVNGTLIQMTNTTTGYFVSFANLAAGSYAYTTTCVDPLYGSVSVNDNITISGGATGGGGSRFGGGSGGSGGGYYSSSSSSNAPSYVAVPTGSSVVSTKKTMSAFELIDVIKDYYKGVKTYTAFEILDLVKSFYGVI